MRRAVVVLMSITVAAFAADQKGLPTGPASSYPGHITQEKITVAAKPYNT